MTWSGVAECVLAVCGCAFSIFGSEVESLGACGVIGSLRGRCGGCLGLELDVCWLVSELQVRVWSNRRGEVGGRWARL